MQAISRRAALEAGVSRYYTGQPCSRGHIAERQVSNWTCISCIVRKPPVRTANAKTLARLSGAVTYATGKPCRLGHIAERVTATGRCKECLGAWLERSRLRQAKWYQENGQALNQRLKDARPRRPKFTAKMAGLEYYFTGRACSRGHIDKRRVSDGMCMSCCGLAQMEWARKNPEASRAITMRRRARRLNAEGSHTPQQLMSLMRIQRGKCAYCKTCIKKKWHADHISPLSKGGANAISNIQLLCPKCNQRKNAKDPIHFAQTMGFLL